jgi:HSP20 family protein
MLTTRWFPAMNQLQREVNRMLDQFIAPPGLAQAYPPLNLWEDNDNLFVEAELPGMHPDKVEIHVAEGNKLTLQGERPLPEVPQGTWHRRERGFGKFSRTYVLPVEVQADKVEARFENGVLRLTLPKSERLKSRRIPVRG